MIVGFGEYAYTDETIAGETTYYYRVADVDAGGNETLHEAIVVTTPKLRPTEFAMSQNYPNPFNPATTIQFALKEQTLVTIKVHNTIGQLVCTLVDEQLDADYHSVSWDGVNDSGEQVVSGVYFYTMQAGDYSAQKKMTLLK